MRIAAIYDIHGNLPALAAVLHEIDQLAPDLIVVGGDVAAGPMPRVTIERLMELGPRARFISGNTDRYMVECFDGTPADSAMAARGRKLMAWAADQLDPAHRDFLAGFAERATFPVDGLGDVLFCHATPHSDEEILTPASSEQRVRAALAGIAERVVVCGHTHIQHDRVVDGIRILNAGSVGMPYGQPGAHWLLLGDQAVFKRTDYDLEQAAEQIRASDYPNAQDFADNNVRQPPSAEEATQVLENMAQQA
jgi:putative phosphoesterase